MLSSQKLLFFLTFQFSVWNRVMSRSATRNDFSRWEHSTELIVLIYASSFNTIFCFLIEVLIKVLFCGLPVILNGYKNSVFVNNQYKQTRNTKKNYIFHFFGWKPGQKLKMKKWTKFCFFFNKGYVLKIQENDEEPKHKRYINSFCELF